MAFVKERSTVRVLPSIQWMSRVERDIDDCIEFVARQPWGRPDDRERDILNGIKDIPRAPLRNPVLRRKRSTGLEFRRHNVAQFAIIYAYMKPSPEWPSGKVSIRAVRHRRVKNVFMGVREPMVPYDASPKLLPHPLYA